MLNLGSRVSLVYMYSGLPFSYSVRCGLGRGDELAKNTVVTRGLACVRYNSCFVPSVELTRARTRVLNGCNEVHEVFLRRGGPVLFGSVVLGRALFLRL